MDIFLSGDVIIQKDTTKTFWGDSIRHINNSDLTCIPLNTCITDSDCCMNENNNFKIDKNCLNILKSDNNKYINIANEHIFDYNTIGLEDTINHLNNLNMKTGGAGTNKKMAKSHNIYKINGFKILIFSANTINKNLKATKNTPGLWFINIKKYKKKLKYIKKIIKNENPDLTIFTIHWKEETKTMKQFSKDLISIGINIIQGHGINHILPYEYIEINNKYSGVVFYSLGMFSNENNNDPVNINYETIQTCFNWGIHIYLSHFKPYTIKIINFNHLNNILKYASPTEIKLIENQNNNLKFI